MLWFAAMVALLPFMAVGGGKRAYGIPLPWGPRARTWAALFGASLAAWLTPHMVASPVVDTGCIARFIVIDAIAGGIVLAHPAGWVQKFVGAVFALMVSFHIGFLWADNPSQIDSYTGWQAGAGWAQFAALASWGLYDFGKAVAHWLWPLRYPLSARAGV